MAVIPGGDAQAAAVNALASTAPTASLAAVTPNDNADLSQVATSLWVGGAGNIALIARDDSSSVILQGVVAGQIIPVITRRILATGTTATNIVAMR